MKKILSIALAILPFIVNAQSETPYQKGELLVRAKKSALNAALSEYSVNGNLYIDRSVSGPMDIWMVKFNPNEFNEFQLLENLKRDSRIHTAQFNHIVHYRDTLPNDAQIEDQWQYVNDGSNGGVVDADIDMDQAWDITTGGVTALGDTIVVCVLDDGIDTNHVDFEDNLWINTAEIPGNGIDDDSNGYVDDYKGWNIATQDDSIDGGWHGTPVAGIIGAKGNNGIGVSGISWDVKVMVIRNDFDTDEAAVLAAYTYPLVMRRKYNETNGAEGAFVVATNASWGIDRGDPASSPLWCAFYDTLGAAGILSCGATANDNINVDVDGDLPTGCSSDYLISVTNIDRTDTKVQFAGYGKTTIDLGAFGEDTYTTAIGNGYEGFGGTSGATPHVAGTVGLLYSISCSDFAQLARDNPAAAAISVKEAILNGVDANTSLTGITVTEGRLNVFNSTQFLLSSCDSTICTVPFSLKASNVSETSAILEWNSLLDTGFVLSYKSELDPTWTETAVNSKSFALSGLKPCQNYQFQVRNSCDTGLSDNSSIQIFRTEGCSGCTAFNYCESYSTTSSTLHIKNVTVNTLNYSSV